MLRRVPALRSSPLVALCLSALLGTVGLAAAGCGDSRSGDGDPVAEILRVIDGDTIDVRLPDGTRQRVRLLGVDTPEKTTLRSGAAECGGEEATHATQALARRWPRVTLAPDAGQDTYDRYDRLLAYVTPASAASGASGASDTTFQEELLGQGWAKVYVFERSPFSRVDAFRDAAAEAKADRRGVWRVCGGQFRRPIAG